MSIKQIEETINEILHKNIEARDDDNLLMALYLETLGEFFEDTGFSFTLKENRIATKFKTVERTRRKLQEKNPLLRGKVWAKRHGVVQEAFVQYALDLDQD